LSPTKTKKSEEGAKGGGKQIEDEKKDGLGGCDLTSVGRKSGVTVGGDQVASRG